jgi:hypothetical protein
MRRPSIKSLMMLFVAIYVVWVALTVGELWPFHRMFDAPPESRMVVFYKDLYDGGRVEISPREAHLLWVIRDPEPADGTFDTFARNFSEMFRRASPLELPVVIPLDILMTATGESFTLLRQIAIVAAGLILATVAYFVLPPLAAFVWRWIRTPSQQARSAGILVICGCCLCYLIPFSIPVCYLGSSDELSSGIGQYILEHVTGDPVITIFAEDSRFAHFAATQDLRLGSRIDLSQREFSTAEIEALIERIDDDRVWVLFERGAPYLDRNFEAVVAALEASGRGFPFLRGPSKSLWLSTNLGGGISESELSDYWHIRSYDANSDTSRQDHRISDVARCGW